MTTSDDPVTLPRPSDDEDVIKLPRPSEDDDILELAAIPKRKVKTNAY